MISAQGKPCRRVCLALACYLSAISGTGPFFRVHTSAQVLEKQPAATPSTPHEGSVPPRIVIEGEERPVVSFSSPLIPSPPRPASVEPPANTATTTAAEPRHWTTLPPDVVIPNSPTAKSPPKYTLVVDIAPPSDDSRKKTSLSPAVNPTTSNRLTLPVETWESTEELLVRDSARDAQTGLELTPSAPIAARIDANASVHPENALTRDLEWRSEIPSAASSAAARIALNSPIQSESKPSPAQQAISQGTLPLPWNVSPVSPPQSVPALDTAPEEVGAALVDRVNPFGSGLEVPSVATVPEDATLQAEMAYEKQKLTERRTSTNNTKTPRWVTEIKFPMLRYSNHSEISLVDAIHNAIQFSPEIEILRADVDISQAEILRQSATFDWNSFVEANWDERNVPVGSDLDGSPNRLENHTLNNTYGVQKRNQIGGQLQLAQDLGFADSNSQFFNPQNQANARIALEYQQPLLQGAGLLVNTSQFNIAVANASVSQEEFIAGLQEHILDVITAYWDLVSRRGEYVIQKRSYERALETATVVANRVQLDVGPVQSARAEATLGARRTALLQAEYAVVFAQEKLLRLIFGTRFKESVEHEIIPTSEMLGPSRQVNMEMELQLALQNRPEIRQSIQLIKRTSIEQGVATNQLLPLLGLSLTLSNQGLQGNRGLASAINDQWDLGDPTYGIGVSYELPIGNRAAKANLRQAQLRLHRFQKEFEEVISDVALEVRNAARMIEFTSQQRSATGNALSLAERELETLQTRAVLLLDGDEVGPLYLEDLLQTQERLAVSELAYLSSIANYAQAQFELQRANGSLLRTRPLPVEAAGTQTWQHRMSGQFPN